MNKAAIPKSTLSFLRSLEANNNREWFAEHKSAYTAAQQHMIDFVDELVVLMNKHDEIENTSGKGSLFRIYNDVRFSKDKSPFNPRFAFSLQRSTALKRGGYYLNLKPRNCFLACGFFGPNAEDLKRIRQDIDINYKDWQKLLKSKGVVSNFGSLQGKSLATAPRGFAKDHEAIELLRYQQFLFRHEFTEKEVLSPDFLLEVNRLFKAIRPFFDYMSEVLTTDLNGESII